MDGLAKVGRVGTQKGFTLLELMVTVSIVGVLAAISALSYQDYQAQAHDREAQVALRIVVIGQEAYFVQNSTYVSCDQTNCHLLLPGVAALPNNIQLSFTSAGASCIGTATHPRGTGITFDWTS